MYSVLQIIICRTLYLNSIILNKNKLTTHINKQEKFHENADIKIRRCKQSKKARNFRRQLTLTVTVPKRQTLRGCAAYEFFTPGDYINFYFSYTERDKIPIYGRLRYLPA